MLVGVDNNSAMAYDFFAGCLGGKSFVFLGLVPSQWITNDELAYDYTSD